MNLLFLETSLWELDFIVNDILYKINPKVEMFQPNQITTFLNRPDLIETSMLVVNHDCNFNDIINVATFIKPIAIFYFSDESGCQPHITKLEKYTKLFFRQYNFKHYMYGINNYQLPLGYVSNYLNMSSLSKTPNKIKERELNCSFVGTMKSDRSHMIDIFSKMEKNKIEIVHNNWNIDHLPYPPKKMFDLYQNSIFVIIGRGNLNLDCFRIYEAISAGSIPVLVGNKNEIEMTFHYHNNLPPFIYETSWEKAFIVCNDLLQDFEKLQKKQDEIITWWKKQILFINTLILNEIH